MYRKVVGLLGTLTLIGMLCFGAPVSLFASTPDDDQQSAYSKEVTESRVYDIYQTVPPTIPYDKGGWSGTLRLVQKQSTGDHILAYYRGTVYCSGNCVLTH